MALPFLEGNWFLIKFLCSDITWNDGELVFATLYSQIQAKLQDPTPSFTFSLQIANKLVSIFHLSHIAHLEKKMGFFARNSPLWEQAFTLYFEEITTGVERLVAVEKELLTIYTQTEIGIWNRLAGALKFVRHRFTDKAVFLPASIGSIPFLSPAAVVDILASLGQVQVGYTLVSSTTSLSAVTSQLMNNLDSQIFSSITPGITMTMESQRQGGKNFKNFYSQSEVFFHNLEYWAGYSSVPNWPILSAAEIAQDPAHLAALNTVKHKVISVLLLARLNAFSDLGLIKAILSNKSSQNEAMTDKKVREKAEKHNMDSMLKKVLASTELEAWEQENVKRYKDFHDQKEPTRMEWNLRHIQHPSAFPSNTLAPAFQGLSHTHFNWMASTVKTNHVDHRKRIIRAIIKESYFWELNRMKSIEADEHLFSLFSQLFYTITSSPLLKSWEFWLPFDSNLKPNVVSGNSGDGDDNGGKEDNLDKKIQDQSLRAFQAEKKEKLLKVYRDLIRNLNQDGLCGIADEDGAFLLHPALEAPLKAFEKVIVLAVFILA